MMAVLPFKRVGTLQLSSYGNHEICTVRAYSIIYVYNLNGYQNIVYFQ